jgi:apolipoprotein N-acyltransferase
MLHHCVAVRRRDGLTRSVNELARAVIGENCRSAHDSAMALIWLLAGATLLGLALRFPLPPLTWLALTLLLHASRSWPPSRAIPFVALALFAAMAFGRWADIPTRGPAYWAIVAAVALTFTVPFALDRLTAARLAWPGATLVFPLAFVAAEFLQSRLSPAATWGSIAYTQYGVLPLMQVAAVAGIWGITFLIAWFATTAELVWSHAFDWSTVGTPVAAYALVFGAIVIGGTIRVAFAPTDRPSLRVAAVNRPVDLFVPGEMTRIEEDRMAPEERDRLAGKLTRLQDWFLNESRREAAAGARLVAWPETNLLVFAQDEPAFLARAEQLARDAHVYLAMGMGTVHQGEPLPMENKIVVIDPAGTIIIAYRKSHPVQGWEAGIMRRGDGRLPVVATPDGRIGAAICFDADFPEFIRQAGTVTADFLIVPANEWKAIKVVHAQMAAFRAIENGVSLIRPAASGLATAVDPWGRRLGVADYFAPGDRTMVAQVPRGGIRTIYARIGDLFAWLCVAGVLVCVGLAIVHRG